MITMMLGSQGSGKTVSCIREMLLDPTDRMYFSNIITKGVDNNILIKPDMIVKKTPVMKDDKMVMKLGRPVYNMSVNKEFWQEQSAKYGSLNVIIDEAHSILNARRGQKKEVQPILDWISMLRRVLGSTGQNHGRLYLVTQIERRLDVVAKEQATQARYHLCHYKRTCPRCMLTVEENNETPEPMFVCPRCNVEMKTHSMWIEVWHFQDWMSFVNWKYMGRKKQYYRHYGITDIAKFFPFYNTLQWENLISEV